MMGGAQRIFFATFILAAVFSSPAFAQFNAFKDPSATTASGAVSGPDLKASLASIAGGTLSIGATAYIVTLFKNNGTSPVKVTDVNLYPSSNVSATVSMNKCAESPLPPEAECAVTIAVTALQVGSWRVEVLIDHDGRTRLATASVTGDSRGAASEDLEKIKLDLEATPEMMDFGNTTGGLSLVKSVLFRNRTSEDVKIKAIRFDSAGQAGFTYKSECPEVLKPSETCNIAVSWTPVARGVSQAVLAVVHDGKSALTTVEVQGIFAPTAVDAADLYPESVPDLGLLVSDKESVDFGSDVSGASAITVSLVNTGSEDLALKAIRLSGSDSGLSVARSGCRAGTVLKPVEACALTVNWLPSRAGTVIDDLQITHSGARGILVLPIRGTASAAISRETLAVRQTSDGEDGGTISVTPVLDGYIVTSLSSSRAVINGPVGSIVVRDGEDVVVSGVKWTVSIVTTGVILTSEQDEIMLVFDKSLKPTQNTSTTSSGSTDTSSSTTSTTTATSATTN